MLIALVLIALLALMVSWEVLAQLWEIKAHIKKLERKLKPAQVASVTVYAYVDGQIQKEPSMAKVTQKISFVAKAKDIYGNEVLSGPFAFSLIDSEMGALEMLEDGKSAKFIPSGKLGMLTCGADLDGKHGESEPIELVAGDAEVVSVDVIIE